MIVDYFVVIINLFFVPVVSLNVHQHLVRKDNPSCKRDLIMQYGIYTALNLVGSKTVFAVIRLIWKTSFVVASGYYTLVGLAVAALLPLASAVFRKFFSTVSKIKKNEKD